MKVTTTMLEDPVPVRIISGPVLAVTALWLAGAIGLGVLIGVLGPPAIFLLAYRMSAELRAWVAGLELSDVRALQG